MFVLTIRYNAIKCRAVRVSNENEAQKHRYETACEIGEFYTVVADDRRVHVVAQRRART